MLKKALLSNAVFSGISGLCILLLAAELGSYISLPPILWLVIGLGLLFFSFDLMLLAVFPAWAKKLTKLVIFSDISWVLVTTMAVFIYWEAVSLEGVALIVLINLIVTTLAWFQAKGYHMEYGSKELGV